MSSLPDLPGVLGGEAELTPEDLRERLRELGETDPELGHGAEDELVKAVLGQIRDGHPDPAAVAAAALYVTDVEFPRWYG